MKVKEILSKMGYERDSKMQVCFLISEVHKNSVCYRVSAINTIQEWFEDFKEEDHNNIMNFNILNVNVEIPTWLSGVD